MSVERALEIILFVVVIVVVLIIGLAVADRIEGSPGIVLPGWGGG